MVVNPILHVTKNKQPSNRFHFHHLLIHIFKNVVACKFKHLVPIYRLNKLSYQVVLLIKRTSPLIINVPFFYLEAISKLCTVVLLCTSETRKRLGISLFRVI